MCRLFLIIGFVLGIGAPVMSQTVRLSADERGAVEERVKKYCGFMELFAGNLEQIDKMDSIFAMCENDKVQTFDDISPRAKSGDIEYNSLPLFQYLQNITSKFDNSLQVEYSGFRCEKVVSEPKMNSLGLGGSGMPGGVSLTNAYASVRVVKKIKGSGIDKSVPLRIMVNLSSFKIGGTVSEEYEDPYSLYLEGVEMLENGDERKGMELLEKCSGYKTYPGRFRAMTIMGVHLFRKAKWAEAERMLTMASEQDPVGGVMLAQMYVMSSQTVDLRIPAHYYNPTKAMQLLERYASVEDKDCPEASLVASYDLAAFYIQGNIVPRNLDKAGMYLEKIDKYVEGNNVHDGNFLVLPYSLRIGIASVRGDLFELKSNLIILENLFPVLTLGADYKLILYSCVYGGLLGIYKKEKNTAKYEEYLGKLKTLNTPVCNKLLACEYREANKYEEALKYYRLAADGGEPDAAYVMSFYYIPSSGIDISQVADGFDRFLYSPRPDKDAAKSLSFAKMAAEQGHADAEFRMVQMCFDGPSIGLPLDVGSGVEWVCRFANSAGYSHARLVGAGIGWIVNFYLQNKDKDILSAFERKAAQGDPAAAYVCYQLYCYVERDTVMGFDYLRKSAEGGFYQGLFDIAASYSSGVNVARDYGQVPYWANQLVERNFPIGYVLLAEYEAEVNHDYKKEMDLYLKAIDMKEASAALEVGKIYLEGRHGHVKDLEKAKFYLSMVEEFLQVQFSPSGVDLIAEAKLRLGQIEAASVNGTLADSPEPSTRYMTQLDVLSDQVLSPDERIAESERLLPLLFASSDAVVKIIGSNGTTIVATETAADFLMRLSTAPARVKVVRVSSELDAEGKIIELIVREEK